MIDGAKALRAAIERVFGGRVPVQRCRTHKLRNVREGLEELFTINRLGLTPALCRALGSTNIIENPNSTARRKTNRVTRWRDGEMVKRWAAAAFLDAERSFRRILGYRDLWMLKAILNENQVANGEKAA